MEVLFRCESVNHYADDLGRMASLSVDLGEEDSTSSPVSSGTLILDVDDPNQADFFKSGKGYKATIIPIEQYGHS